MDMLGADLARECPETLQGCDGPDHALIRELALGRHAAAEAAQDLLIKDRRGRPSEPVIDHETHGIGADVDDGDRTVFWGFGSESLVPAHVFALAFFFKRSMISGGTLPAWERPRPERDGFFMK